MYNKNHSEKTKNQISKSKTGTKQPKIQCKYCPRKIGNTNIKRHEKVCKDRI